MHNYIWVLNKIYQLNHLPKILALLDYVISFSPTLVV